MTFKEMILQMLHHDFGFLFFRKEDAPARKFRITAKGSGILCGTIFIPTIVDLVDREFFLLPVKPIDPEKPITKIQVEDGNAIVPGDVIAKIYGNSEVLLKAERTILYILSRLSGIATHTAREMARLTDTTVVLLDTRKDNPLEREMDKYAVRIGGGRNHRTGFYDGILIKDNDIHVYGGITPAIDVRAKDARFLTKIEIEVSDMETLKEVLDDGRVDVIMLDNMPPKRIQHAIALIASAKKSYIVEASGVGNHDLNEIAACGVNTISLSSLVSAGSGNPIDISMKCE